MGQIVAEFMEYWGKGRDPANSSHSLKPQGAQYESNRGVSRLETAPGAPMVAPGRCELVVPLEPKHQNPSCRDLKQRNHPILASLQPQGAHQRSPAAGSSLEWAPGGLSSAAAHQDGVVAQHQALAPHPKPTVSGQFQPTKVITTLTRCPLQRLQGLLLVETVSRGSR